jgi:hypothetical protein
MGDDLGGLRAQVVRLYALALQVRDRDPGHADQLVADAIELQDRAMAIEEAAGVVPLPDVQQQQAQQQQQVQPKKSDDD